MATPPFSKEYLEANKGPQVIAIIIIFPILATTVVILRLYTRFKIVNNPSWDDFTIFLALILSITTAICQGFQVYNGMGRHIQSLTFAQGVGSLKALFASIMVYNFGLVAIKISILLQYLRIAIGSYVKNACYFMVAFTIINGVQTFLTGIFSCVPVAKFWDDRIPGTCVNKSALWFANAGINIFQDFYLLILPIFILRKLTLPRRQKVSLVLILGLGGFASLASILRLHAIYIISLSKDVTWDNPGTAIWSTMEINIGIICASLPTLRALLAKYFPGTFSSNMSKGRGGYHSGHSARARVIGDNEFGMAQRDGHIILKTDINVEDGLTNTSPLTTVSSGNKQSF